MTTTLELLEARSKVVAVRGELPLVAAALDALAAYEQAATSCATAMNAQGGMADAVIAALSSASVASAAAAYERAAALTVSLPERQYLQRRALAAGN